MLSQNSSLIFLIGTSSYNLQFMFNLNRSWFISVLLQSEKGQAIKQRTFHPSCCNRLTSFRPPKIAPCSPREGEQNLWVPHPAVVLNAGKDWKKGEKTIINGKQAQQSGMTEGNPIRSDSIRCDSIRFDPISTHPNRAAQRRESNSIRSNPIQSDPIQTKKHSPVT